MSAIAGILGKTADQSKVHKMIESIRHRGPNRTEFRNVGVGIVGVGELTTSKRSSPAISSGSDPTVLLDGELYNDLGSSASNVELVRELYGKYGKKCFAHMDGTYACAIIDGDETILARDGVGARPLIYHADNGTVCFAGEAKALLDDAATVTELAPKHYFSTLEGLTGFDGFAPSVPAVGSPEETAKTLEKLLVDAVRKRMEDGAVTAIALSGGLDSSIIAAVAKSINPNVKLFSTTIKRYPSKDLEFAKLMARYLGLEHEIYEITDEDIKGVIPEAVWYMETFDEDCVSGAIANFFTSKMIARHSHCVAVGEGADELFGGYFRELKAIDDNREKERVAKKLVDIAYNTALRRLDRGWLSNSVNYRTPYLAPEVVAFALSIPMEMKHRYDEQQGRHVEKWILRQAFKSWLPEEIYARPKLRFAGGTGVDDLMDELTADKVDKSEWEKNGTTRSGMKLFSPKELHYYRLFGEHFPAGYEHLTARWDPFK